MTTIRQLPNTDTLRDDDLILVSSGGTSKNISWGQVKALLEGRKETVKELYATNAVWMPTNINSAYTTNLYSITWVTNDFKPSDAPIQRAIEVIATIPKPNLSSSQWGMILFGAIISIVCLTRIAIALRGNRS